jgi:hypothetical protein
MTGPAGNADPVPARVPAKTIRLVRLFHRLEQAGFAACFQVTLRTVYRWEKGGVDPELLEPWRRKLLFWMRQRYEATASVTTEKQGDHP